MPITNPQDIRLTRQDDLEAIIGHPPGWTLRWGLTALATVMALLLGISWYVSYPDIVHARVVLTTQNPPIRVVAQASGQLDSLQAENGTMVEEDQILGILNNPANWPDVQVMEQTLTELSENDPSTYLAIELPSELELGSMQRDYATFSQNFSDLQYFLKQDINFQKISNLRRQIVEIKKLEASLSKQIDLFAEELALSENNLERVRKLFMKGVESELKFENTKTAHLIKSREMERLRSESASNQLEIQQLEASILDLRQKQSDNQNEHLLTIKSDIQRLKGILDEWKQQWLLMAPIAGEVALTNTRSNNQFVNENDTVLTIIPITSEGDIVSRATLTGVASGKVDTGMPVHIRLAGYPYQEFGVLNGSVSRIAGVPGKDGGYEVEIALSDGMKTSYNKELEFQQEMKGIARIVTEERSLLMRILEKIRAALEE